MEQSNKYHPYTKEEFATLKSISDTITTHIPNDKAGWVWDNYIKLNPKGGSRPCTCGSAAGYWKTAMETIKNFITSVENA